MKNFKEGVIGDCVEAEVCGNEVLKRFLSFIKQKVEVKEIFNKLFTLWEERCGEPSREELENLQRDLLELAMSHQMGQQHQWDGQQHQWDGEGNGRCCSTQFPVLPPLKLMWLMLQP